MDEAYPNLSIDFGDRDEQWFERLCGDLDLAQQDRARFHYATIADALVSEIEALMGWALIAYDVAGGEHGFGLVDTEPTIESGFIQPQFYVGRCRLDFMLNWASHDPHICLAVECDGRDYHSSPRARQRDRRRDGFLSSRGVQVMRFPGAEIFKNPLGCAAAAYSRLHEIRMNGQRCNEGVFR